MPMYTANSIIETQILFRSVSGIMMNQVYFRMKMNTPDATIFATTIRSNYFDSYRLIISNQAEIFAVKSRRVEPGPPSTYVQETVLNRQGGVISNSIAEGCSHIIVLRHARATHRTGRMYSILPPQGAYLNGQLDPNQVGRLNSCINGLNSQFTVTGSNLLMHQVVRLFTPAEGGQYFYEPVTEFGFREFMGWQRSRIRHRGI